MHVIRRFARQVAERFKPDRIILFGSHANGTPHADSDVDILVVMPAPDELHQAYKIRLAIPALPTRSPCARAKKHAEATRGR
jgi:predicted nucleotidyltransferase